MFTLWLWGCQTPSQERETEVPDVVVVDEDFPLLKWTLGFGTSMDGDIEPCG